MTKEETVDPFEQARREAENFDDAEDARQAAAEDSVEQAASDAVREQFLKNLLTAARGLISDSSFDHLIRQGCFAGLGEGQLEALLKAIRDATGITLSALRSDKDRIAMEVAEARRQKRREEAQRRKAMNRAGRGSSTGDPMLDDLTANNPPPEGCIYKRGGGSGGVALSEATVDKDGETILRPLCSPFTIDARLDLPHGGEGLRIRVRNSAGRWRTVHADGADLGTAQGLGRVLSEMTRVGMVVLGGKSARDKIADVIAAADPATRIKVVGRPGFHIVGGKSCFVIRTGELIGAAAGTIELDSTLVVPPEIAHGGSFDQWKKLMDELAASAEPIQHWLLAPIIGFASPLVEYLGLGNTLINYQGLISIGKTTAQMLAASVWSIPAVRNGSAMQDANTTVNNVEVLAELATGTILIIDETKLLSGAQLIDLIFRISGGMGRGRLSRESKPMPRREWHVLTFLSSEHVLETKVRDDRNASMTTGGLVRALDLQLDGHVQVFSSSSFPNHVQDTVKAHYGHAGPRFIEQLLTNEQHLLAAGKSLPEELRAWIKNEAQAFARPGAGAAENRTLETFALLKVAGELAVHFDLLPKALDIAAIVDWAFKVFIGGSGLLLNPLDPVIDRIRLWVDRNWNLRVVECEHDEPRTEVDAWYDEDAVYIPTDRIGAVLGRGGSEVSEKTLGRELKRRGLLVGDRLEKDRNTTRRIPNHPNIPAYPLDRYWSGPGGNKAEDNMVEAMAAAVERDPQKEVIMRKRMGDAKFEEAMRRAAQVRAERARREQREKWGGGV